MKYARRHHYIPRFYLAGFTEKGAQDDKLWVLDQDYIKQFKASPVSIGFEKDYNAVEIDGVDPDSFEKSLSKFEGIAAPVIKKIVETEGLPPSDMDYNILINFIALMALRVPSRRKIYDQFIEDSSKIQLDIICQSKERFESYTERMRAKGVEVSNVSYEQMVDFLKRDQFTVKADTNTHIANILRGIDAIIRPLADRQWMLVINDNESCPFICSDNPVSIVWTKEMPIFYSPGFGLRHTEVTFPLNKRIMLLGRFEQLPTIIQVKGRKEIAMLNSRTAMYANRHIYSTYQNFPWLMKNNDIGNIKDLLRVLRKEKLIEK